jgi:hypothetical protein
MWAHGTAISAQAADMVLLADDVTRVAMRYKLAREHWVYLNKVYTLDWVQASFSWLYQASGIYPFLKKDLMVLLLWMHSVLDDSND